MKIINEWLKLPEDYDKQFWQYNEFNIQELAFHNHDGENGDKLSPGSRTHLKEQFITDSAEGFLFAKIITLPTDVKFDDTIIQFFDPNGNRANLEYSKVDDDNYKVLSPYNDVTFEANYA